MKALMMEHLFVLGLLPFMSVSGVRETETYQMFVVGPDAIVHWSDQSNATRGDFLQFEWSASGMQHHVHKGVAENGVIESLTEIAPTPALYSSLLDSSPELQSGIAEIFNKDSHNATHVDNRPQNPFPWNSEDDSYPDRVGKKINGLGNTMYKYEKPLQKGGFGEVWQATTVADGTRVAIKVSIRKKNEMTRSEERHLFREVGFMEKCSKSPYVVRLLDKFQDRNRYYIVMEYVPGRDLKDNLEKIMQNPDLKRRIFYDILRGLRDIHRLDISHRDMKLQNVLLTADQRAKITDFGLSGDAKSPKSDMVGTKSYMAPEIFAGLEYYGEEVDVFAAGVTLYRMVTGRHAYGDPKKNAPLRWAEGMEYFPLPHHTEALLGVDSQITDIIYCTQRPRINCGEADCRCRISDIMEKPWIQQSAHTETTPNPAVATKESTRSIRGTLLPGGVRSGDLHESPEDKTTREEKNGRLVVAGAPGAQNARTGAIPGAARVVQEKTTVASKDSPIHKTPKIELDFANNNRATRPAWRAQDGRTVVTSGAARVVQEQTTVAPEHSPIHEIPKRELGNDNRATPPPFGTWDIQTVVTPGARRPAQDQGILPPQPSTTNRRGIGLQPSLNRTVAASGAGRTAQEQGRIDSDTRRNALEKRVPPIRNDTGTIFKKHIQDDTRVTEAPPTGRVAREKRVPPIRNDTGTIFKKNIQDDTRVTEAPPTGRVAREKRVPPIRNDTGTIFKKSIQADRRVTEALPTSKSNRPEKSDDLRRQGQYREKTLGDRGALYAAAPIQNMRRPPLPPEAHKGIEQKMGHERRPVQRVLPRPAQKAALQ